LEQFPIMRPFILLLSAFLLISASVVSDLLWQERELKWSDFKPMASAKRIGFKAETYSGIRFESIQEGELISFRTECYFNPEKSWVLKGAETDYLLNHEQGHFDITEIYARKFREELEAYQMVSVERFAKENLGDKVNAIYTRIMNEMFAHQNRYDEETNHSINSAKQAVWDSMIESDLSKRKAYSSE